ncbi:MAG: tyrosine-type recombinase/integrase [Fuerstiella sp.]
MASLSKEGPKNWRIQFMDIHEAGKRRTLRVSGLTKKQAEDVHRHIENIVSSKLQRTKLEDDDATWLGSLVDKVHAKLVKAGLAEPRDVQSEDPKSVTTLVVFLEEFITDGMTLKRDSASIETLKKWKGTRDLLLKCFDEDRDVSSFTVADGKTFRKWMEKRSIRKSNRNPTGRMMENSMRQRIANCKTFFSYAVNEELVPSNPFRNQASNTQDNEDSKVRISAEVIKTVIEAAPTVQWKLMIALWRFAGLRKMEAMHLIWNDILWDEGMIRVRSTKTAHHEGKEMRYVPIRDVEVYLRDAFELATEGDERLISQYRPTMTNLHKPFAKIIENAGLQPWPALIKNLRLSCENDWIDNQEAPDHVIAAWIGHSVQVQRSDYALVSAGHFEQFNNREVSHDENRSLCASDDVGSDGMRRDNRSPDGSVRTRKKAENQCFPASKRDSRMLPEGLEPSTY